MNRFLDLLGKKIILLDGGFGTELQKRGMAVGENPSVLSITSPQTVTAIHEDYFKSGSDVVCANTFSACAPKLSGSGYSVQEVIHAAVACAKKAAAPYNGLIALDIGPIGELLEPLGALSFERAVEIFSEQIKAGANAGADLITIETMMDIYEAKAALLAAKESCPLPVVALMTFEETGRSFTGCDISSMALTLSGCGADALGINCSVGPKQLVDMVKTLRSLTDLPIVVKPNAGLPRADGGYDLTPEEFCTGIEELIACGASVIGGCCGTAPEHIRLISRFKGLPVVPYKKSNGCFVCSSTVSVDLNTPVVVGERLNPTGKKLLKQALSDGDMGYIMRQAVLQQQDGAQLLDINVGLPGIDEPAMMAKVVKAVQSVCPLPLQIDSSNPEAIEAGLRVYNGRAVVNSINGKEETLCALLPVIKRYGAAVVGLTLDENGIPEDAEGRVKIAERIVSRCESAGIPREDIIIDCLTMTAGADQRNAGITLSALKQVHDRGIKTALGVSNISFGLPQRGLINRTFFTMALQNGLNLAIINPADTGMMEALSVFKLLCGFDKNGEEYLAKYTSLPAPQNTTDSGKQEPAKAIREAVLSGLEEQAAKNAASLLETQDPQQVINSLLIPILDEVGTKYEKGEIFLPQLIRSAGAAKAAFDEVRRVIAKNGGEAEGSGDTVVIATVQGDIHDIGKNIVRAVLENYGYRIIDLGRDVPPERILEAVLQNKASLCGLSALMTTTLPAMQQTIALLRERAPGCRTVVGGAVLTRGYAESIGASRYAKDAAATVQYAKEVFGR